VKMQEIVKEYNKLTGKKVKRFATKSAGEKALAKALKATSTKDPKVVKTKSKRDKVKVSGVIYKSVADAFRQLDLPMGKHIKFRSELKKERKKYSLKMIKRSLLFSLFNKSCSIA